MLAYPKGFNTDGDFITVRKNLAEYLEEHLTFVEDMVKYSGVNVLEKAIKDSERQYVAVKVDTDDVIRYYVQVKDYIGYWYIEDVDTTKLWLLSDYDGGEDVLYYQITKDNRLEAISK